MTIEEQLLTNYELADPDCKNLNTPTNDVFEVITVGGHFALKLYHAGRTAPQVQWELDLLLLLIDHDVPVAKPVVGKDGYLQTFKIEDKDRAAILYEWALGDKPKAEHDTYVLLGTAAAQIHAAADSFTSSAPREVYDATRLIDEQLRRMEQPLKDGGQWQRVVDLTQRLRKRISSPTLDYGVCHMDLTLDNVHVDGDQLTVFDFDSASNSWRANECWGVKRLSEDYFQAWLQGYRSVRMFSEANEQAVSAFAIVGEIRNIVWKLGLATSSRGEPVLKTEELPQVVDGWLEWEKAKLI